MAVSDIQYSHDHFGTYSMEEPHLLDGVTVDEPFSPFISYDSCDRDYIMSPISSSMPLSTSYSATMSPDKINRSLSPLDAYMDDQEYSDESESDQLLESLMANVHPHRTKSGEEFYRCIDVPSTEHACDYEDKRKCNLRY